MNVRNSIDNLTQVLQSQNVTNTSSQKSVTQATTQGAALHNAEDRAAVSSAATQVAKTSAVSDVRLDKVASIQSQLQAGTYQVPASAVAQKVISAMLGEEK